MNARKKKIVTAALAILFAVYLLVLAELLFFANRSEGHRGVNLRPFRSISNYLSALRADRINPSIVFRNLCGNFLLFMPMAFCFPMLFPAVRKWYFCLPLIALIIVLAEIGQYLFAVGSCDIDDFILNFAGALVAYLPGWLCGGAIGLYPLKKKRSPHYENVS